VPGYHLIVLKRCIELSLLLRRNKQIQIQWLDDAIRQMLTFVLAILQPDGLVPLLKDTARDLNPNAIELIHAGALLLHDSSFKITSDQGFYSFLLFGKEGHEEFSGWPDATNITQSAVLKDSGFVVIRNTIKGDYCIFDFGKVCPEYLPAHAHADLFSYELFVSGNPIIVDSGVYSYGNQYWRDYFRSTRAHNTVSIANLNQSDVWSSFRVGKRAVPGHLVKGSNKVINFVQCSHDGYARGKNSATHRRTLASIKDEMWIIYDELFGRGSVDAQSFIHFHPNVTLEKAISQSWLIKTPVTQLYLTCGQADEITCKSGILGKEPQGWYSQRFGELQENSVIEIRKRDIMPFRVYYMISKIQNTHITFTDHINGSEIVLDGIPILSIPLTSEPVLL
jgi:hypothetical protein